MIKVIEEVVSSKQDIEKYGDKDSTDIENDVEDFREDGDDIKKKVANKKVVCLHELDKQVRLNKVSYNPETCLPDNVVVNHVNPCKTARVWNFFACPSYLFVGK